MGFSPISGGFDVMFTIVPVIVVIGFILVAGLIVIRLIKGSVEWSNNNNSSILTVAAKIVAKRMAVSSHNHANHGNDTTHHHSTSTTYFITFEVESGSRMKLKVKDKGYGLLAEGDSGKLTFQGTRYKGFDRALK